MSVIDQAFIKAYARRTKPQAAEPMIDQDSNVVPASDLSIHPQAADSAVVWIDTVSDQYLRRDASHATAAPPQGDTKALSGPSFPVANAHPKSEADRSLPQNLTNGTDGAVDLSTLYHTQFAAADSPQRLDRVSVPAIERPAEPAFSAPAAVPATTPLPAPPAAECELAVSESVSSPAGQPFTAAWEVDMLEFSSTVRALFTDPALAQSIGGPLDRAVNEGLQTVMITSERSGVGQTSVATGIALSAAIAGLRVALVDAAAVTRRAQRSLADSLNLDVQYGWLEAMRGGLSVAETAVHSIEDQLTIIPQTATLDDPGATADEFNQMISRLRHSFDLIVIDGPCCTEPTFSTFAIPARRTDQPVTDGHQVPPHPPVDAVILVQDMRDADPTMPQRVMQTLKHHGITGLGLVENFT